MDFVIGFVTELTGEKRGPRKNYRRFNIITLDNINIGGWIFSSMAIEDTVSGKILLQAVETDRAVRIRTKVLIEEGKLSDLNCRVFPTRENMSSFRNRNE